MRGAAAAHQEHRRCLQPAIESLGLTLVLQLPESPISEVVMGDSEKIEVVLTNLLGNAAKFTERGGRIEVRLRELAAEHAVEIDVIDSGPGIPLGEQPHIFERFRRVESPGRKTGGAGIGLALVKELVELHGGAVSVDSAPGAGSCFTIRLRTGLDHLRDQAGGEPAGRVLQRMRACRSASTRRWPTSPTVSTRDLRARAATPARP